MLLRILVCSSLLVYVIVVSVCCIVYANALPALRVLPLTVVALVVGGAII